MKKIFTVVALALTSFFAKAQVQYINDPSFETGFNSPVWNDTNNNSVFGCILSNASLARTGTHCFSMGLPNLPSYKGSAEQAFTVLNPSHLYNARLEFYIKCLYVSGSSNDIFIVAINQQILKGYLTTGLQVDSATVGPTWKKITVPIDTLTFGINLVSILFGNNLFGLTPNPAVSYSGYLIDDLTVTAGYPTAISNLLDDKAINVYPTAIQDYFTIENNTTAHCTATLFNLTGQALQTTTLSNTPSQQIDAKGLQQGMYFLQIRNNDNVLIKNIKLQKI